MMWETVTTWRVPPTQVWNPVAFAFHVPKVPTNGSTRLVAHDPPMERLTFLGNGGFIERHPHIEDYDQANHDNARLRADYSLSVQVRCSEPFDIHESGVYVNVETVETEEFVRDCGRMTASGDSIGWDGLNLYPTTLTVETADTVNQPNGDYNPKEAEIQRLKQQRTREAERRAEELSRDLRRIYMDHFTEDNPDPRLTSVQELDRLLQEEEDE